MESDKIICVCEKNAQGASQISIVDLENGNSVTKKPIAAEAAIMNPVSKIIALRGKKTCWWCVFGDSAGRAEN